MSESTTSAPTELIAVASAVPPEAVEALLGAVRPWCAREVEPAAAGWDAAESLEPGLGARLAELGLFGVSAAEADGGAGVGLRGAAWLVEAIAAASGSLAAAYAVHEAVA
ncbi:MAG: acyl-CoA dehydrogenase family protein, partial [Nannocystaceae bacterium]|nr:acyl-CoA dehydrogenase family protein [Nannocystaceae bacterium]